MAEVLFVNISGMFTCTFGSWQLVCFTYNNFTNNFSSCVQIATLNPSHPFAGY